MLVSHVKKFIYCKAVKVAGTSVEILFQPYCQPSALITHLCAEKISKEGIVGFRNRRVPSGTKFYNHMRPEEIRRKLKNDIIFDDYFKFCVVRNPWDRFVSVYNYFRYSELMSFKKFSQNMPARNCILPLFDFYNLKNYSIDYFIRFEDLKSGIKDVCNKTNIDYKTIKLRHFKNKKNTKHYTEYYDNETRELVAEKYAKDIEYFGYKFGE